MLQNIFSHRPPLQKPSNKAEITEVPSGCCCGILIAECVGDYSSKLGELQCELSDCFHK